MKVQIYKHNISEECSDLIIKQNRKHRNRSEIFACHANVAFAAEAYSERQQMSGHSV
jgi:hypothetical protein